MYSLCSHHDCSHKICCYIKTTHSEEKLPSQHGCLSLTALTIQWALQHFECHHSNKAGHQHHVRQPLHYLHGNRPLGGYGPCSCPEAVRPLRRGKGLWLQEGPSSGSRLTASNTALKPSSKRKKCSMSVTVSMSCSICNNEQSAGVAKPRDPRTTSSAAALLQPCKVTQGNAGRW